MSTSSSSLSLQVDHMPVVSSGVSSPVVSSAVPSLMNINYLLSPELIASETVIHQNMLHDLEMKQQLLTPMKQYLHTSNGITHSINGCDARLGREFCTFDYCKQRVWFPGFQNKQELDRHMTLHRCQWLTYDNSNKSYNHCHYVPANERDLMDHVERHIIHNQLPTQKYLSYFYCCFAYCV